ncbi:MAG TPA: SgcJ/EcaC family oxidoreductase [Bryobacterales bacterium]|nr:SgcJ/EcaC family oxidoreductase [Bryobacterales bacterium]
MTNDEQAIYQMVQRLEAAWNAGDSAGFAAPFAEDADFVNVLGEHHNGRAAIEAGHRQLFETFYKGSHVTYTVEGIRSVRPDVAVAFIRARLSSRLAVTPDDPNRASHLGESTREDHARPTMVLAKDHGKWQIVAFQNTRVAQGPPPATP